jgi:predicted nucleic-acid-binding protein
MLGIDTNVLVRFLVKDDDAQFAKALKLIEREWRDDEPILISQLVLLETEWVLRSQYGMLKSEIANAFAGLLDVREFQIEDEPSLERALFVWRDSSTEFADCLIGERNRQLGCNATATFDSRAAKLSGFVAI